MDPVHPWVDPSEMRRLAEALLVAPAPEPRAPDDAGFGGDFVGYAGIQRAAAEAHVAEAPVSDISPIAPQISEPAPAIVAPPRPVIVPPAPLVAPAPAIAPTISPAAVPAVVPQQTPEPKPPADLALPAAFPAPAVSCDRSMAEQIAAASRLAAAAKNAAVREVLITHQPPPAFPPFNPPPPNTAPAPVAVQPVPAPVPVPVVQQAPEAVAPAPAPAPAPVVVPPLPPQSHAAQPAPAAQPTPFTLITPPAPVTSLTPVKVRGPFLERMAKFRDHLHQHYAAKGVFILDKEGAVIFDESDHSRLHFMARSLAMAAKKNNDGPGNVHVKVGSTSTLEVIPVETVFGRMVLGLLIDQPLPPDHVTRLIQTLQSAVAPPNPS